MLLEEISSLIVLGQIKDPRVSSHASVMYVKVSKDMTAATVFVSSYLSEAKLQKTIDGLNHARGFIQKRIAQKYAFKHTPKLLFKKTEALKQAESIMNIMQQNAQRHGEDNSSTAEEPENNTPLHER